MIRTEPDNRRLPAEWIDYKTPIDHLEAEQRPFDAIRDARVQAVRLLNGFAFGLAEVLARPDVTLRDVEARFWSQSYALGLLACNGMSVTRRSELLGVERATLSNAMVQFCTTHGLPPSQYMRDEEKSPVYQAARLECVRASSQPHQRAKPFKPMPELPP